MEGMLEKFIWPGKFCNGKCLPGKTYIDINGLGASYLKMEQNFKCQNMRCNAISWGSQ